VYFENLSQLYDSLLFFFIMNINYFSSFGLGTKTADLENDTSIHEKQEVTSIILQFSSQNYE